jgi:RNA polymerase-binding transcription factor DksA
MHDLQKIEENLRRRLAVLKNRMEEVDEDLSETGDDDFAEMATEVLENIGHLADQEAEQIFHALDRIKKGIYGTCQKCGVAIAPKRLEAIPHTALCIKCAQN